MKHRVALVTGCGWLAIRYFQQSQARPALLGVALMGLAYAFAMGFAATSARR